LEYDPLQGESRSTLSALTRIRLMWQHWVNALLGLAVIAVPFIGLTGNAMTWTLAIIGIVVAALGFWGALADTDYGTTRTSRLQHQ
jgi:hypothetical protein